MTSTTSDETHVAMSELNYHQTQDFLLHQQFAQAMLFDDDLAAEIPRGATLVLIPDQNPELAAFNLKTALAAAEHGRNVYIRYVYLQPGPPAKWGGVRYGPYPPKPAAQE